MKRLFFTADLELQAKSHPWVRIHRTMEKNNQIVSISVDESHGDQHTQLIISTITVLARTPFNKL